MLRGSLGVVQKEQSSDLRGIVESALARRLYLSGRNLRFEVHEYGVVLRGVVRSYYHKQLAQESLKSIAGLPRIHNEIEVVTV
jgi:osmotically-inducible protein OsmY